MMTSQGPSLVDLQPPISLRHDRSEALWDRFLDPTVFLAVLAVLCTLLYRLRRRSDAGLASLIRSGLLRVTPSCIFAIFDTSWQAAAVTFHMPATEFAAKGDALCRIFGLGQPGLVSSVTQAARRRFTAGLPGMWLEPSRPAGLGNRDSSCFQNSVLQGLSALDTLQSFLAAMPDCVEELECRTDCNLDSDLSRSDVIAMTKNRFAVTSCTTTASSIPSIALSAVSWVSPFSLSWQSSGTFPATGSSSNRPATAESLGKFLLQLRSTSNNGKVLWTPPLLKSMNTSQQQDAQEYFSRLLDQVDSSLVRARSLAKYPTTGLEIAQFPDTTTAAAAAAMAMSGPRNPLEGMLVQRVVCTECRYSDGLSLIPFNCLTLNLPPSAMQIDLESLLENYARVEAIDGVDCCKCTLDRARRLLNTILDRDKNSEGLLNGAEDGADRLEEVKYRLAATEAALEDEDFDDWRKVMSRCKISLRNCVATTKTKQVVVARPPKSLVLHINRSVYDELTGAVQKNTAYVDFPTELDMGPWCLGESQDFLGQQQKAQEKWGTQDPYASLVGTQTWQQMLYELRAVITHTGRHENGHYVCFKSGAPAQVEKRTVAAAEALPENAGTGSAAETRWWRLSDENVRSVTQEEVRERGGAGVFMLFYDRSRHPLRQRRDRAELQVGDIPSSHSESGLGLKDDCADLDRAEPATLVPPANMQQLDKDGAADSLRPSIPQRRPPDEDLDAPLDTKRLQELLQKMMALEKGRGRKGEP